MYNNMVKFFFGFQPDYAGVYIKPCLPKGWASVSMAANARGTKYRIRIHDMDGAQRKMFVNGNEVKGNFIPYRKEKQLDVEIRGN